jgi:RNA binding exosome subunit
MYYRFTSDVTRLGPILTPYVLEIDDNYIRYSKRNKNLLNKDKITMAIDTVTSVEVNTSLLGTTIVINGFNDNPIVVKKFNIQDAYRIQEIINNQRERMRHGRL